jgi:PAS domain S-box-containing protein
VHPFKNLSIGVRLFSTFIAAGLLVGIGLLVIRGTVIQVVQRENPKVRSALEMEINIWEATEDVLDYLDLQDPEEKQEFSVNIDEYKILRDQYATLIDSDEEKRLLAEVDRIFVSFSGLAREILELKDQQESKTEERRLLLNEKIEIILDDQLQPLAKTGEAQQAILEMEINIHELISASRGYILKPEPFLKERVDDSIADFDLWEEKYRATPLSASERLLVDQITQDFTTVKVLSHEILDLQDRKQVLQSGIEADVYTLDRLFDESIQKLALQKIQAAESRIIFTITALIILATFLVLGVVIITSRSVIKPLRNLQRTALTIAGGNLDQRAEVKSSDEVGRLAAAFNEMTEKLMNERKSLTETKAKDEAMLASIGDGLVAIDQAWIITLWNRAAGGITGWSSEEAIGKPFREIVKLIREDDGQANFGFIEEAMKTGKTQSMETHTTLIKKDGSKISVGDSAAPIFDQDKQIAGVIIVFRDVSMEYKIHQLKEQQKQFLDTIFSNIPVGVMVAEAPLGKINFINPAAIAILGHGAVPKATTNSYTEVYDMVKADGTPYPSTELPLSVALLEGKPALKDDIIVRKPDGRQITVRARSEPIKNQAGQVTSAVAIFEDITEQVETENNRDEFFSIASHELRTPLTAIRGNSSMMLQYFEESLKDPSLKGMVEDIHAGSVRLIELVNDFLDSSRLEQGRVEFKITEFDLTPVIRDVMKDMKSVAKGKKLELKLQPLSSTTVKVKADPDRLKQILFNLIGNALKFTERGGVSLDIKPAPEGLKLRVIDTGSGIPADKQSLLFQKYQQAGRNTMTGDVTKGSGLGLYISRLLAEGMGGTLGLQTSIVDKGSTFVITLPLATGESQAGPA